MNEARHRGRPVNENGEEREGRIWLERGIASARAGRRAEARQALFRALNYESQREMCWLWLAAVSEDAQQERVYLNKVLTLNPNNRFARAGLAHLDAQPVESGIAVQLAGAGALGLLEAAPVSNEEKALPEPSPVKAGGDNRLDAIPRRNLPAPQPDVAQITVHEAIPPRVEQPAAAPAVEPPRRRPAKSPVVKQPIALPALSSGQQAPSEPAGKEDGELSGWTVGRKPVAPLGQRGEGRARAAEKPVVEPSGWTRSVPKATAAPQPRSPRYEVNPPSQEDPGRSNGGFSGALSEMFQSHETWTAMAATVSLAGLAFILIALAVMSVFR